MGSLIVFYKGQRGCGKTLTMIKDGYNYWKLGYKILRNFKCKFGKYIDNETILTLNKLSNINNCVLMIDEIQIFFDSRSSMRKSSIGFSNFIQQIRKRNIILLCTAQYTNTTDLRLRQHIDIMAYPKFKKSYNVCKVTYIDLTSLEDEILGRIKALRFREIVYNAKPLFKYYDTKELII